MPRWDRDAARAGDSNQHLMNVLQTLLKNSDVTSSQPPMWFTFHQKLIFYACLSILYLDSRYAKGPFFVCPLHLRTLSWPRRSYSVRRTAFELSFNVIWLSVHSESADEITKDDKWMERPLIRFTRRTIYKSLQMMPSRDGRLSSKWRNLMSFASDVMQRITLDNRKCQKAVPFRTLLTN